MKWLLLFLSATNAYSYEFFDPNQNDKRLHLAVAGTTTALLGGVFENELNYSKPKAIVASFLLVNLAGLMKEMVIDDRLDGGDLAANAMGGFMGGAALSVYFLFE